MSVEFNFKIPAERVHEVRKEIEILDRRFATVEIFPGEFNLNIPLAWDIPFEGFQALRRLVTSGFFLQATPEDLTAIVEIQNSFQKVMKEIVGIREYLEAKVKENPNG